jgi:hypothetical protein
MKMDMLDKQMWFTSLGRNFPGLQVWGCFYIYTTFYYSHYLYAYQFAS